MATYKVIQDIEAEDKLVGPLSLRQFIYAGIVIVLGFIAFQLTKASPVLAIPLLIPMLFFGALAAPIGQDQPSEVWLLAKVRFFLKPRRRIWNQDGISQLVTITAPKKIEQILTDGLSQTEVKSRLSALANTLDSRGWAVKNVSVNLYGQAGYLNSQDDSDRLVSASSLPQDVPTVDVTAMDDMMDEEVSPTAQNLERMIVQSEQAHHQQLLDRMSGKTPAPLPGQEPTPQADYWFMSQQQAAVKPGLATFDNNPVVSPGMQQGTTTAGPQTADEQALLSKIHDEQTHQPAAYGHMKTILPIGQQPVAPSPVQPKQKAPAAKPTNPDIIRLANNDDLNIATIARQANKNLNDGDEVVISLH
jgi:hypothetical protein